MIYIFIRILFDICILLRIKLLINVKLLFNVGGENFVKMKMTNFE